MFGNLALQLMTDSVFSYCVEILKWSGNATLGHGLSLEFAWPQMYHPMTLIVVGIFVFFVAGIADCYLGKYLPVRTGVFFSFIASCMYVLLNTLQFHTKVEEVLQIIGGISILIFFVISPIRNVLLLEQIRIPSHTEHLRMYIFLMIYFRLLAKGLHRAFTVFGPDAMIKELNCVVAFVGTFAYYVLLVCCIVKVLYFENIYYCVWGKCVKCFYYAIKGTCHSDGKRVPKPHPKRSHKTAQASREAPWTLRSLVSLTASKEVPPPPTKYQKFKTGVQQVFFPPGIERFDSELTYDNIIKDEISHWLCWARPISNEFEISQTYRAYKIIPFVFFGVCFSWLNYYVLYITALQGSIVKRNSIQILDRIDVLTWVLILEIFLYPSVEFFIFPYFSTIFDRDPKLFTMGYFILLLSLGSVIFVQFRLMNEMEYVPSRRLAQLRVFNGKDHDVYIKKVGRIGKYTVPPYEFLLIKNIKRYYGHEFKITSSNITEPIEFRIHSRLVTLVITEQESNFTLHESQEPSIFTKQDNGYQSFFYMVTSGHQHSTNCSFRNRGGIYMNDVSTNKKVHSVLPGMYNITIQLPPTNDHYLIQSNFEMKRAALYTLFLIQRANGTYAASMIHTEGPIPVSYIQLLPQIFLLALGNALANVSFVRFLFLESPRKLRSSIFAVGLALNSFLLAFENIYSYVDYFYEYHKSILIWVPIFHAAIVFCTAVCAFQYPYIFDY